MADLKFGDVIKFSYCGAPIIAMVVLVNAVDSPFLVTDEGTAAGGDNTLTVFGLVGHVDTDEYHQVGKTASFHPSENHYEILP